MEAHTLETLKTFEIFLDEESGLPLEGQRAILDQLLESLKPPESAEESAWELAAESSPYRAISKDLLRRDRFYAIHGDDLHLDILKEAVTLSGVLYAALQNPVAVIGGLVVMLYKYRRKRIPVNTDQALVLFALRRAPEAGWTAGRLWHELPLNSRLDQTKLLEILADLKEVWAANGKPTALTAEKDGRWWVIDV